jgi:hypothetical protein
MPKRALDYHLLRGLLIALGLSAIAIALLVFSLGIGAVTLVERTYDTLLGRISLPPDRISPTLDSELRFYAPFWLTYGLLLLWVSREMVDRLKFVPALSLLFFAGGIGRVISAITVGLPHPSFVLLMSIELVLPPMFILLYWRLRPSD